MKSTLIRFFAAAACAVCVSLFLAGCSKDLISRKELEKTIWTCSMVEYDSYDDVISTTDRIVLEFLARDKGKCHFPNEDATFANKAFKYDVDDTTIEFSGVPQLNGVWYVTKKTDKSMVLQIYKSTKTVMTMTKSL